MAFACLQLGCDLYKVTTIDCGMAPPLHAAATPSTLPTALLASWLLRVTPSRCPCLAAEMSITAASMTKNPLAPRPTSSAGDHRPAAALARTISTAQQQQGQQLLVAGSKSLQGLLAGRRRRAGQILWWMCPAGTPPWPRGWSSWAV